MLLLRHKLQVMALLQNKLRLLPKMHKMPPKLLLMLPMLPLMALLLQLFLCKQPLITNQDVLHNIIVQPCLFVKKSQFWLFFIHHLV